MDEVAREIGVGTDTLQRWRSDALGKPGRQRVWTAAARFDAVLTTAAIDEAGKSAWCRANGVYPQALEQWRQSATQALAEPEEARASPQQTRATGGASRSSSASCAAKTVRWRRLQPCWCCQKKSRRSSTGARTNDRPRRSPSPGP